METEYIPKLIAWETTRMCNLSCIHCRASAEPEAFPNELNTKECIDLLDDIASFSKPIIILTGGDPLLRPDIFDIASYGSQKGLRIVLSTNGTNITKENARKMVDAGIKRVSISLDGLTPESHDDFRKVKGAFINSLKGINLIKEFNIDLQINTSITKKNLPEIRSIHELAIKLGAVSHHIFLLVPTGRGKEIAEQGLSSEEYEETLNWFYEQRGRVAMQLKATCAPQFYRILRQRAKEEGKKVTHDSFGLDALTKGCLGGQSFAFISHSGKVQICGYLEVECGDIRDEKFRDIWYNSKIFQDIRDLDNYHGRCGYCEYRRVCGGCRARAYAISGDYLAEELFCMYQPKKIKR